MIIYAAQIENGFDRTILFMAKSQEGLDRRIYNEYLAVWWNSENKLPDKMPENMFEAIEEYFGTVIDESIQFLEIETSELPD